MNTVILDGTQIENCVEDNLKIVLSKEYEKNDYFKLSGMNILPCRACGSCGYKTPGKCIINDEMGTILKAVAQCDVLIFFTEIKFGGYSSNLKKAVDRLAVLGIPLYFVKNGYLLHPGRYPGKKLLGIGLIEKDSPKEEENFRTLVARNSLNTQYPHKTLIFKLSEDAVKVVKNIEYTLREVANIE